MVVYGKDHHHERHELISEPGCYAPSAVAPNEHARERKSGQGGRGARRSELAVVKVISVG